VDPISERLHQAIASYQSGQTAQAEAAVQAMAQEAPERGDVWGLLGLMAHQRGQHPQAIQHLQRAIAIDPQTAAHHSNLGIVYATLGDRAREEACYRQAVQLQPNDLPAVSNLGTLLCEANRWDDAVEFLGRAVSLDPNNALFQNHYGDALRNTRRIDQAVAAYQRAITLDPNLATAYNGLGMIVHQAGDLARAEQLYRKATQLMPKFFSAHSNLGNVLAQRGEWLAAVGCYRTAIAAAPQFAEGHANLANVLGELGQLEEAVVEYRTAIQLNPIDAVAYGNLAETLIELGEIDEAERMYARRLAIDPNDGIRVRAAIAMPAVTRTIDEVKRHRARVAANLDRLRNESLRIDDPIETIGAPLFYAGYHGENERPMRQLLAEIVRRASPAASFVAPHCQQPRGVAVSRPKIGFISRFFHVHSIARHYTATIRDLRQHGFEVIALRTPGPDDEMSREVAAAADRVVTVPIDLSGAQAAVAAERLDVLLYTDIGMDPLTYHLAYSRLAPVQCLLPGHPVTSGISTIDYFLSCDDFETLDAQHAYTERLVRLKSLPTGHARPQLPALRKTRRDFQWDDNLHYYVCAQPLFKLHPGFDRLLGDVLRSDPAGRLVLFRDHRERWNRIVEQRLDESLADVRSRVVFQARLPHEDFWQLVSLADVMLDTPHFNGGTTTTQTLGIGTPLVTLPGAYLSSRVTYGCYRRLGVLDAVADSEADYVARAVRIGTDRAYRNALAEQIRVKSRVMFEENEFVSELAGFLRQVSK
jgi:predicted O-linked N-acetylglucosamine transferase (SPINDLY family)